MLFGQVHKSTNTVQTKFVGVLHLYWFIFQRGDLKILLVIGQINESPKAVWHSKTYPMNLKEETKISINNLDSYAMFQIYRERHVIKYKFWMVQTVKICISDNKRFEEFFVISLKSGSDKNSTNHMKLHFKKTIGDIFLPGRLIVVFKIKV